MPKKKKGNSKEGSVVKAANETSKIAEEKQSDEPQKTRVWEITSHVKDENGDDLFTPEVIETYLSTYANHIKRWCWVKHDRDVYTEEDLEKLPAEKRKEIAEKIGTTKPAHIHLVVQYYNPVYSSAIAKDIGLPEQYVQKAKAKRNQFIAIAAYFTHEDEEQQKKGKAKYSYEEIHTSNNFDLPSEVAIYFKHRKLYKSTYMPKFEVNGLIEQVAAGELSFKDIKEAYGFAFFLEHEQKFLKAYREYVKTAHEMQPRINIFIEGPSGRGKSSLAIMLAKYLYTEKTEEEACFVAGKRGVRFDDYVYQPVVVWDDVRFKDLRQEFGIEGMLNLLEIYPKKVNYNIKYGGVILINQVNIFTGIEDHVTFLDGLMSACKDRFGEDEGEEDSKQKKQAYRRMAMVLSVYPTYFEVKLNQGLFQQGEYTDFKTYARVKLDIFSMNKHYTGDAKEEMIRDALKPIKEKCDEYFDKNTKEYTVIDEIFRAQQIEVITDTKELEKENEEEKEKRSKYELACAEDGVKTLEFEEWRKKGCPETSSFETEIDTYKDALTDEVIREMKLRKWLNEALLFGKKYEEIYVPDLSDEEYREYDYFYRVIEELNVMREDLETSMADFRRLRKEYKEKFGREWMENDCFDEEDSSEEEYEYEEEDEEVDEEFEEYKRDTAKMGEEIKAALERATQQLEKCAEYLRDKYQRFKNEKVVQKIAELAKEMGVISQEDDFGTYIGEYHFT